MPYQSRIVWGMSECDRQPLGQGAVPWVAVRSPVLQVGFSHWVREQEAVSRPLRASGSCHHSSLPHGAGTRTEGSGSLS